MVHKKRKEKFQPKPVQKVSWGTISTVIFSLIVTAYFIARYYHMFDSLEPRPELVPEPQPNLESVSKYDGVLIWWIETADEKQKVIIKECGPYRCLVTENHEFHGKRYPTAYLLDGAKFHISDMPLPREPNDYWGLYYDINPKEKPIFAFESIISLFNFTSTFSRFSDVPLTLRHLIDHKEITEIPEDENWTKFVEEKIEFRKTHPPVMSLQEDDTEDSKRDAFLAEFNALIGHDRYLNIPYHSNSLSDSFQMEKSPEERKKHLINFIKRYKFMLIYEETKCLDYISRQFWIALEAGLVPIYFGPKTIKDWVPNPGSVIFVQDFDNLTHLVEIVKDLDEDMDKYSSYLEHKSKGRLANQNLVDFIEKNSPLDSNYRNVFECYVCTNLAEKTQFKNANLKHFDCSEDSTTDSRTARCSIKTVDALLKANKQFTSDDVAKKLEKFATNKEC